MSRISEVIAELIQKQVVNESNSVRLYRACSEYLKKNGWFGAAELFRVYSEEEQVHVNKFIEFLQDRDVLPELRELEKQPSSFKGIKDIATIAYQHEIDVTGQINNICKQALKEGDLMTYQFLHWFENEQIEEEAKTRYWIDRIKMMESMNVSLFFIDEEMKELSKK